MYGKTNTQPQPSSVKLLQKLKSLFSFLPPLSLAELTEKQLTGCSNMSCKLQHIRKELFPPLIFIHILRDASLKEQERMIAVNTVWQTLEYVLYLSWQEPSFCLEHYFRSTTKMKFISDIKCKYGRESSPARISLNTSNLSDLCNIARIYLQ